MSGKTILLGVGAGIAAYKVAYVVRGLRQRGHVVHVIPTENSLSFVGEQTWQELSENPVSKNIFHGVGETSHVRLARQADLFLVAPATADLLAKLRLGLAPDMLTATFLASECPKLLVPAMHHQMWHSEATQENVRRLRARGFSVMQPAVGKLSSGDTGDGRLPEPEEILAAVDAVFGGPNSNEVPAKLLSGKHVVVTAGGTMEAIDPVRYLANHSTGRQGVELALASADAGARVTLLVGQVSVILPDDPRISIVSTPSAEDMLAALKDCLPGADALFMAAAVADYRPKEVATAKLKKNTWGSTPVIELQENPDILRTVAHSALRPPVLVGFAAETGPVQEVHRLGKMKARTKGADIIAINRVGGGAGFGEVPNTLLLVDGEGLVLAELSGDKRELAVGLVGIVAELAG